MDSIRKRLTDASSTQRNVKLFLLRLIVNCEAVFAPFAAHLLPDILDAVSNESLWPGDGGSQVVNYFTLDVVTMLLGWSQAHPDAAPDASSFKQRSVATAMFEQLVSNLKQVHCALRKTVV